MRSGAMLDQVAVREERMPFRECATAPTRTIAMMAAPHSGKTDAGRLPIRCTMVRHSARGSSESQCNGTAAAGA